MPDKVINTRFNAIDRISAAFNKMGNNSRNFGNRANSAFNKASGAGSRFGDIIKGILGAQLLRRGFQLLKEGLGNFITQASLIEDATARFQPLMGSVEKSTELVNALNDAAATTPFQFEGISNIAALLLPKMNGSIEDTIDTFRMLGDTAGGDMQRLESITRGYTKALNKGKPDMESLNMIAEAGVPIFDLMAESMGITTTALFELSKQGLLTNEDLTKTFQDITSEGGDYFKGMEIASATLSGKISTLQDNVNMTFAAFGSAALPIMKQFIDKGIEIANSVREWAKANQELIQSKIESFINTLKVIFETLAPPIGVVIDAVFKLGGILLDIATSVIKIFVGETASMEDGLNAVAMVFNVVAGIIDGFASALKFLKPILVPLLAIWAVWTAAQWLLNVAMSANPIGLIIAGVALLVAGIMLLIDNWDLVVKWFLSGIQEIGRFFQGLWDNILWPIVKFFIDVFGAIFQTVANIVIASWNGVSSFFLWIWNDILVPFGTFISEVFGGAFSAVADAVIIAWQGVADFFTWIWDNVIGPIVGFISDAIATVGEFFNTTPEFVKVAQERQAQENQTAPNEQAPNTQEAEAKTFSFLGKLDITGAPEGSTVTQNNGSSPWMDMKLLLGANP